MDASGLQVPRYLQLRARQSFSSWEDFTYLKLLEKNGVFQESLWLCNYGLPCISKAGVLPRSQPWLRVFIFLLLLRGKVLCHRDYQQFFTKDNTTPRLCLSHLCCNSIDCLKGWVGMKLIIVWKWAKLSRESKRF